MKKLSFFKSALAVSFSVFALSLAGCTTDDTKPEGEGTEDDEEQVDPTPGEEDPTPGDENQPQEPETLKVGDPYVVNGKTVGIIYEIDDNGEHGKAFSLTVYNLNDKFLCVKEGTEQLLVPSVPSLGTTIKPTPIEEAATPNSDTDGAANCEKMKNETDWKTTMRALNWVEDLATADGVDWYIPAIEELKDLVEYMSGAEFTELTNGEGESATNYVGIDPANAETIAASWANIRTLYSTYAPEDQYIVFQTVSEEDVLIDSKVSPDDPYVEVNDLYASQWLSSTVANGMVAVICTEGGLYSNSGCPEVWPNAVQSSIASQAITYASGVSSSIHPICKF